MHCTVSFNEELSYDSEWLRAKRLSLNDDKTSYMTISNKKLRKKVEIAGKEEMRCQCQVSGCLIEGRLSFMNNVNNLQKQVCMTTGMLKKVSNLVPA